MAKGPRLSGQVAPLTDEEKAAAIIMTARAPWFAEEQGE